MTMNRRMGRGTALLLTCLGSAFAMGVTPLCRTVPQFMIARFVSGIFSSHSALISAHIVDLAPLPEDQARLEALSQVSWHLAHIVGPSAVAVSNMFEVNYEMTCAIVQLVSLLICALAVKCSFKPKALPEALPSLPSSSSDIVSPPATVSPPPPSTTHTSPPPVIGRRAQKGVTFEGLPPSNTALTTAQSLPTVRERYVSLRFLLHLGCFLTDFFFFFFFIDYIVEVQASII
jgi:MFS family permease